MEADDIESKSSAAERSDDRRIAERLDSIEAEKVVQRALELEADSIDRPSALTPEQIQRVAGEIGLAPEFVQQALREVFLAPPQRSRFARWVLPEDLFETVTVGGVQRAELDAAISKWMTQREGLARGALLDDGVEWHVDRRWRVRALARSLSGGNRISRVAGGDVLHRVQSSSDVDHFVALASHGRRPLFLARTVIACGLILSALLLLGSALENDLVIGLPTAIGLALATTWAGVAGARWWARGIRGALRRSLAGLIEVVNGGGRRWLPWQRRP